MRRLVLLLTLLALTGRSAICVSAAGTSAEIELADGVYVVRGSGVDITRENAGRIANAGFVVGPRGVVVVGSGVSFRHGEAIIAAVEAVTRRPIRVVVITHAGQEVLFGAAAFQARGIPVLMHRDAAALMAGRCDTCLRALITSLGERAMVGSRVVTPDRIVTTSMTLDAIGRPLRLIAPSSASSPGALAVLDTATRTLFAGSLVTIERIPDLRDAEGRPWRNGLATLASTHCRRLVPTLGRLGTCADIAPLDRYFASLDRRVRDLVASGTGLADVASRADMPEYAEWDDYEKLHAANANRAFLAVERAGFGD